MRFVFLAVLLAVVPAAAADDQRTVGSIAESPLSDVNLKRKTIPPVLQAAVAQPYATAGLTNCARIGAAVKELDAALGRDLDNPPPPTKNGKKHDLAMDAGQDVMNGLIPGRSIIREVTGAEAAQRRALAASLAGSVRRGFLKGLGVAKGCAPPAVPRKG